MNGPDKARLQYLASELAHVRAQRRQLGDTERDLEDRIAELMNGDHVNLDDKITLIRHKGAKRTQWQSEAILAELGKRARVDADGVISEPDEQYERLYELVRECVPLNQSLGWRTRPLRRLGLDPDEWAEVSPGRVSVEVQVADQGRAGAPLAGGEGDQCE